MAVSIAFSQAQWLRDCGNHGLQIVNRSNRNALQPLLPLDHQPDARIALRFTSEDANERDDATSATIVPCFMPLSAPRCDEFPGRGFLADVSDHFY
jgi:hypothetical protein